MNIQNLYFTYYKAIGLNIRDFILFIDNIINKYFRNFKIRICTNENTSVI